jgi:hypothetical protein
VQPERQIAHRRQLDGERKRRHCGSHIGKGRQRGGRNGDDCREPEQPVRDRGVGAPVELLREHVGERLQSPRLFGAQLHQRGQKLIGVLDQAAHQHMTPPNLAGKGLRCFGNDEDGVVGEGLDRNRREQVAVCGVRLAIENAAGVAAKRWLRRGYSVRHCRREARCARRPTAQHIVSLRLQPDARRMDIARGKPAYECLEKLLLFVSDLVGVGCVGRIPQERGRLHRAEGVDQGLILGLRLIDQDIDADRLRPHRVDAP